MPLKPSHNEEKLYKAISEYPSSFVNRSIPLHFHGLVAPSSILLGHHDSTMDTGLPTEQELLLNSMSMKLLMVGS